MNLEYFMICCMFVWIGLLIPFDPWKKNIFTNNKNILKYFLVIIGLIGVVCSVILIYAQKNSLTYLITLLMTYFKFIGYAELIIATIMLIRFIKTKRKGFTSKLLLAFAIVLFIISVITTMQMAFNFTDEDLYLLTVPQFGVIIISSYDYNSLKQSYLK